MVKLVFTPRIRVKMTVFYKEQFNMKKNNIIKTH